MPFPKSVLRTFKAAICGRTDRRLLVEADTYSRADALAKAESAHLKSARVPPHSTPESVGAGGMTVQEFKDQLFGHKPGHPRVVKQFALALEGRAEPPLAGKALDRALAALARQMTPRPPARKKRKGNGRWRARWTTLTEGCCAGCAIASGDAAGGALVLRGVHVLGYDSKNGRLYTQEAVADAAGMYEGLKVYLNHPFDRPSAPRRVEDAIATLENVAAAADGLRGDLVVNPAHPMAETVRWWAENKPQAVGLSHNAVGEGKTRDGVFVIHRIANVRSVDLVADPATTGGLF
jgi:hypothetical protein